MEKFKKIEYLGKIINVSNCGKVEFDGKVRPHRKNADGYPVISINGGSVAVHRLVAMAFVKNSDIENKKEVNHLDFNRENFKWDNLEWVTRQENISHSYKNGRYKNRDKNWCGEGNPNYGNKKLSKFYKENPEISKEKQGRKGLKNGRCRKITMISLQGESLSFNYMEDCISYMLDTLNFNTSRTAIRCGIDKSVREDRTYRGYKFYKN